VTARSANEWREFWRTRGERELVGLLDEYGPCATRVATLLGSRAPRAALVAELARIRVDELGLAAHGSRDAAVADRVLAWFERA
jgi:hypothetical protein